MKERELQVHSIWITGSHNLPDTGALYIIALLWQKYKIDLSKEKAKALLNGEVVHVSLGLVQTDYGDMEYDLATIFIKEKG